MAVPVTIADLSSTASSNSPAGTDTVNTSTGPDDYIRALGSIIKQESVAAGSRAMTETVAASTKATPVDADLIPLADSAASFGLKKLTWANLKLTLGSWLQSQTTTAFTTGGTSTAFTLTPAPALTALAAGQRFRVKFNVTAGATPTLAISGLTATTLKLYNSSGAKVAASATTIISGMLTDIEYDGTDMVILNQLPAAAASSVPAGTIIDFAGAAAQIPSGYILCDGAAVSRTITYDALFAAIGTLWGVGNGTTTFNVPNFPAFYAAVQNNGTVGAATLGQMPSHTHTSNLATSAPGGGGYLRAQSYVADAAAPTINVAGSGTANLAAGMCVLKIIKY